MTPNPMEKACLIGSFLLVSSTMTFLCVKRKVLRQRKWQERITFKKISKESDLGHCFGIDIGGTLAKIVYFEKEEQTTLEQRKRPRSPSHERAAGEMRKFLNQNDRFGTTGVQDTRLKVHSKSLKGTFHFIRFETKNTKNAVDFISQHNLHHSLRSLPCTGGGAHKYASLFQELAGIHLQSYDEIECTILGLNLLLTKVPDEVYTFEDVDFKSLAASRIKTIKYDLNEDIFPYLLVSIGSGVSILHVKGPGDFERVSGSSIGGGTYWGLARLLTLCQSYDEALDLCVDGSNANVDMSVGDIYGGSYEKFHLPATTVASSFGKMISISANQIKEADITRSLLVMITQNIGQIAFLNSLLYKTKKIFFVGNFLRHNKISNRTLAYAINFWSKGTMEARFCKHEGYLGALGAFLRNAQVTNVHGEAFAFQHSDAFV